MYSFQIWSSALFLFQSYAPPTQTLTSITHIRIVIAAVFKCYWKGQRCNWKKNSFSNWRLLKVIGSAIQLQSERALSFMKVPHQEREEWSPYSPCPVTEAT